jgi:hypothetical protein
LYWTPSDWHMLVDQLYFEHNQISTYHALNTIKSAHNCCAEHHQTGTY